MINKLFCRFGSWGICFTYGTWFAIEGLSAVGQCYNNSTCIRKACQFLLSKQLRNGGWGESHLSSRTKVNVWNCLLCWWTESAHILYKITHPDNENIILFVLLQYTLKQVTRNKILHNFLTGNCLTSLRTSICKTKHV